MYVVLLSGVFIAIIAYEAPPLWKKKMWRELVVFAGITIIAMAYAYGAALGKNMPNPTNMINFIFEPISEFVLKYLE
jgi:hypothetical protein